jgi:hypothetical protein
MTQNSDNSYVHMDLEMLTSAIQNCCSISMIKNMVMRVMYARDTSEGNWNLE